MIRILFIVTVTLVLAPVIFAADNVNINIPNSPESTSNSSANSSANSAASSNAAAHSTSTGVGTATVNSNFSNSIHQSLFATGGGGGAGGAGGTGLGGAGGTGLGGAGGSSNSSASPIINTSLSQGGTHIPHQAPMAYAPTVFAINCNQSVSLGVSSPYGGLGGGWTTPDDECNGLRLGTQLYVMGKTAEAMDVICHLKMATHIASCDSIIDAAEDRRLAKEDRRAARKDGMLRVRDDGDGWHGY